MIINENKGWQKIPEKKNPNAKDYAAQRLYIRLSKAKNAEQEKKIREKITLHFKDKKI